MKPAATNNATRTSPSVTGFSSIRIFVTSHQARRDLQMSFTHFHTKFQQLQPNHQSHNTVRLPTSKRSRHLWIHGSKIGCCKDNTLVTRLRQRVSEESLFPMEALWQAEDVRASDLHGGLPVGTESKRWCHGRRLLSAA